MKHKIVIIAATILLLGIGAFTNNANALTDKEIIKMASRATYIIDGYVLNAFKNGRNAEYHINPVGVYKGSLKSKQVLVIKHRLSTSQRNSFVSPVAEDAIVFLRRHDRDNSKLYRSNSFVIGSEDYDRATRILSELGYVSDIAFPEREKMDNCLEKSTEWINWLGKNQPPSYYIGSYIDTSPNKGNLVIGIDSNKEKELFVDEFFRKIFGSLENVVLRFSNIEDFLIEMSAHNSFRLLRPLRRNIPYSEGALIDITMQEYEPESRVLKVHYSNEEHIEIYKRCFFNSRYIVFEFREAAVLD